MMKANESCPSKNETQTDYYEFPNTKSVEPLHLATKFFQPGEKGSS